MSSAATATAAELRRIAEHLDRLTAIAKPYVDVLSVEGMTFVDCHGKALGTAAWDQAPRGYVLRLPR